ncbi:MAG: TIGR04133 family radical SAM/SPASM protein [Firmicutes bacterium]|nr:TIGR04133 family radical SAM/SPASM protein [Bacillota bacterium]MCM1401180.1 TIGR04133 family radical SAM/SPASM protein [Bacteroides sp.]MCM1477123.1 TIGR04133 family radical SAM/SPASM protein [Bacteroides sp.]
MRKLSIRRRLALEINRKLRHQRVEMHVMRQLFWECTHRCNLNCLHCGSDCSSNADHPDMPASDFLNALDQLLPHVDRHGLNIVITGGEPLMRADLEQVGLELYHRELPWGIVTNGLALTPQRFDKLLRAGLHNITVSLDGLEDAHNRMRGNPKSFDRAWNAIKMIADNGTLNFDVVTCVNRNSLSQLPRMAEMLTEAGVARWRLFTIFPSGRARRYPEFNLTNSEFHQLMKFIATLRKQGGIIPSYCCEGFVGNYEGEVRDYFYSCEAGISIASLLIDGSIAACPSIRADYSQGNIYKGDTIWDTWQNRYEAYRNREWMRTGICSDCKMFRYCEGSGMHLREADGSIKHCFFHRDSIS